MRDFKKLNIWNEAIEIVGYTYELIQYIPEKEKFGLIAQIQKSVVSIPSNIAEGCSRHSEIDFKRFLEIALGSAFELETQILILIKVKYIKEDFATSLLLKIQNLQKQINAFISSIKKRVSLISVKQIART